jgi:hypothetical protein
MNPDRLSPELAAGIVFVVQIVGMAIMGLSGVLVKLPPAFQFILGLEAFGLPLIVYVLVKRRRDRGE